MHRRENNLSQSSGAHWACQQEKKGKVTTLTQRTCRTTAPCLLSSFVKMSLGNSWRAAKSREGGKKAQMFNQLITATPGAAHNTVRGCSAQPCQRLCLTSRVLSLPCPRAPPFPKCLLCHFLLGPAPPCDPQMPTEGTDTPPRAQHGSFLEGSTQSCPEQVQHLLEGLAAPFPPPNNPQNHREEHTTHCTAFAANTLSQVTERPIASVCSNVLLLFWMLIGL